jgi:translation initiation factor IF-3
VPVPRRFDRRPPERDQTRINDRIRVPEVRLVGEDGKQIGVIKTSEALAYAQERDLDLVEVAPDARPPVCRVLDYSKYKYEQAQKQKAARKHQQQITIREIKFRPKIAQNDYDTKKGHVERFLKGKDKVKVTIMFRGREVTHPERGVALLDKLAGELAEIAVVEQTPLQDGRNMTMMLAPSKAILAEADHGEHGHPDHADGAGEKKPRRQQREAAAAAADGKDIEMDPAPEVEAPAEQVEAEPAAPEPDDAEGQGPPDAGDDEAEAAAEEPAVAAPARGAAKRSTKSDDAPTG